MPTEEEWFLLQRWANVLIHPTDVRAEDMKQELIVKGARLLDEGYDHNYVFVCLRNHRCDLLSNSRRRTDLMTSVGGNDIAEAYGESTRRDPKIDLEAMDITECQRSVVVKLRQLIRLGMWRHGMGAEVANRMGVSRQYVHRVLKKIREELDGPEEAM